MLISRKKPSHLGSKAKGFTLVELMITLVVAAILTGLALPSFRDFIRTQRLKTASFDLVAGLTYARSEAIKRNTNIDVAASSNWQSGWTVKLGTTTLQTFTVASGLSITTSPSVTTLTFRGDGRLTSADTVFTVDANPHQSRVTPRCIYISLSGRASSKLQTGGSC